MKKKLTALLAALLILIISVAPCFAGSPTDEILNYIITADVNQDGTVNLDYLIEWKVLADIPGEPFNWARVGIPHGGYVSVSPVSSNIKSCYYTNDYGEDEVIINFKQEYKKGDIFQFEYTVVMDYMYQIGGIEADKTNYEFSPGWFDGIAVDNLEIHWNKDKVVKAGGDVEFVETDTEVVWQTALEEGATISVRVYYPNDAYDFDPEKDSSIFDHGSNYNNDYNSGHNYYDEDDAFEAGLGGIVFFGFWFLFIRGIVKNYKSNAGFGNKTTTKITRTKVEYYPVCEGCGAPRPDGATECKYCGRSYIKSEEVLKEDEIQEEDKEALKYKTDGEFHYSSSPNVFVRVNVVHVPVTVAPARSSAGSSGGGCAHSSCACACASCACACACACAGGGRAGCSSKDFYNTGLKLKQLELKKYHMTK